MGASLRHLDKTGGAVIVGKDWADIIAGVASVAEKFGVQNDGTRPLQGLTLDLAQIDTNDGISYARIGLDTATISPPYGLTATREVGSAAWGGTGENRYLVTALTASGETTPQLDEASATIVAATDQVRVQWTQPPGAGITGYKVYRMMRLGVAQTNQYVATVSGASTTEWVDTDQAASAGTPPVANTTAGGSPNYGTAPSLGTSPLTIGDLAIGQAAYYWVNWVTTEAVSETGNPREFTVVPAETL